MFSVFTSHELEVVPHFKCSFFRVVIGSARVFRCTPANSTMLGGACMKAASDRRLRRACNLCVHVGLLVLSFLHFLATCFDLAAQAAWMHLQLFPSARKCRGDC